MKPLLASSWTVLFAHIAARFWSIVLALIIGAVSVPATAQKMYQCGKTFSQIPCGDDAKEIQVKTNDPCDDEVNRYSSKCIMRPWKPTAPRIGGSDKSKPLESAKKVDDESGYNGILAKLNTRLPDDKLVEANKTECLSRISVGLKDPESARYGAVTRIGAAWDFDDGLRLPSFQYSVTVNAKNSYGGYVGAKTFYCVFGLDEKTFKRFKSL